MPGGRVILGGKLRILPGFRNRGLHLLSGLTSFLQDKLRHPRSRHYRLSIASLFFDRPAARAYAAVNPEFRTNGYYVGFWFRFTPDNLASLTRAPLRKLLRSPGTPHLE
ncbi:hypothetical protein [Archangium sp.]|uniref:hypothetical protein n=1 Tax=Archangium sp. TaxID=1872627 RepID=UPI002D2EE2D5|nr:hypothetical protein [Archangium sp.]HYO59262.1 hypothetical protein [Archangium sp.]